LACDGSSWVACRPHFLLPVRVLSRYFRHRFLRLLRVARRQGKLAYHGQLAPLADPTAWARWVHGLKRTEWVVYAKPPFGGPRQVLKYLARYTHRVAIANQRLVAVDEGHVTFRWKDYAHGHRWRTMTLDPVEFLRRFLLHTLPRGLQRIRHYGLLANRRRTTALAHCADLLGHHPDAAEPSAAADLASPPTCPACGAGPLVLVAILAPDPQATPLPWDTS